jgi:hypothetical protein
MNDPKPEQMSDRELRARLKDAFARARTESAKQRKGIWQKFRLKIEHMKEDMNLADSDEEARTAAINALNQALEILTSPATKTSDQAIKESFKKAREIGWELKRRNLL